MPRRYGWLPGGKFNWNVFLAFHEDHIWFGPIIYVVDIFIQRFTYLAGSQANRGPLNEPFCETMDVIMEHVVAGTWKSFVLAE